MNDLIREAVDIDDLSYLVGVDLDGAQIKRIDITWDNIRGSWMIAVEHEVSGD